jgi:sugar phosphate isomerase/epimerase
MIFVSSSCVEHTKIKDSILELASNGFGNIELSGGTEYYENYIEDLLVLKKTFNLRYLIHNYFPPPKEHFVLNLASLNNKIYRQTIDHYKKSIDLAEELDTFKFGLHAGFLFDPGAKEIGKSINKSIIYNREKAINRFCEGLLILQNYTSKVKIYVENNVISFKNFTNFRLNPFLLTNFESYLELKERFDFLLLLDLAHLKVSCNTLNLNFQYELEKLLPLSNYIHISDNNAFEDSNKFIDRNSQILKALKDFDIKDKTITLEIYDTIYNIQYSKKLLTDLYK